MDRAHAIGRRPSLSNVDRVTRWIEVGLRRLADVRLAGLLLAMAAVANIVAASPTRSWLLDTPAYLALLGVIVATGIAGVAVRLPAAWREWRRPGPLPDGSGTSALRFSLDGQRDPSEAAAVRRLLAERRYRVAVVDRRDGWAVHGVHRGYSRLAGLGTHLALVLIVVGAGLGRALAEETRFGLFPGEESLLGTPRPGLTAAVRLDRLDAAFDPSGAPLRFDTQVTFLRDGRAVRQSVLRVNEPGDFDGYLVHAWTYGPAAALRVENLAGAVQFDGYLALGGGPTGSRAPFVELPAMNLTLGAALADARANLLQVTAARDADVIESVVLRPGERARIGPTWVTLRRFDAYVTFLSRRDPGMNVVFAGGGLLTASMAIALLLPRRRVSVTARGDQLRFALRGDRFDDAGRELGRFGAGIGARLRIRGP